MADTGWHIRQSGTIGCEQRSDAEQIVYLPPTRDVRSLLREWVISGRCIILAGGAESLRSSGLPTLRTYSSIAGRGGGCLGGVFSLGRMAASLASIEAVLFAMAVAMSPTWMPQSNSPSSRFLDSAFAKTFRALRRKDLATRLHWLLDVLQSCSIADGANNFGQIFMRPFHRGQSLKI
jgi:hypothetical protein